MVVSFKNKYKKIIEQKIPKTKKPNEVPLAKKKEKLSNLIPIDQIYSRLKNAIDKRISWQEKQDKLWVLIKTQYVNRKPEMAEIENKVGKCTYEIHLLINELCKYRVKYSAMKLAFDFLTKEIKRTQKNIFT